MRAVKPPVKLGVISTEEVWGFPTEDRWFTNTCTYSNTVLGLLYLRLSSESFSRRNSEDYRLPTDDFINTRVCFLNLLSHLGPDKLLPIWKVLNSSNNVHRLINLRSFTRKIPRITDCRPDVITNTCPIRLYCRWRFALLWKQIIFVARKRKLNANCGFCLREKYNSVSVDRRINMEYFVCG